MERRWHRMAGRVPYRKRLLLTALATVVISVSAAALWPRARVALWGPYPLRSFEPIEYNGHESATPAQRASFQAMLDYAMADMQRRHVSARRVNQFLWQMHFFVPVHYRPVDCDASFEDMPVAQQASDIIAMGQVMQETHDAFRTALPARNAAAQASGGEISPIEMHRNDELEAYSDYLWRFMDNYRTYFKMGIHKEFYSKIKIGGSAVDPDSEVVGLSAELAERYIDPYSLSCGEFFFREDFSGKKLNDAYVYKHYMDRKPDPFFWGYEN